MNCPLCNVVCIDRLRVYAHLCHPVKDGGHARKLDEAQALMPERTGQGTYMSGDGEGQAYPCLLEPSAFTVNASAEFDDQCRHRSIATKIGDRVAVLMGRTEWPDGHKTYHWCSGYATEIYPTQTVTALDKPCDGRSHVRRASRFVRVIG